VSFGYFVGLGSNLEPATNLPRAIERLTRFAGGIDVSRVVQTSPVDLQSSRQFLNAVAYLETDLDYVKLKAQLNSIETELGRNRADPDRARKDRTIDLDILLQIPARARSVTSAQIALESYHQRSFLELLNVLNFDGPPSAEPITGAREISCADGNIGLAPVRLECAGSDRGLKLTSRRAALVTGAGIRLGRAIACSLAQAGYDIALHYNSSAAAAEDACREVRSHGVRCEPFPCDFAQADGLGDFVRAVTKRLPHLSVLVNSASVYQHGRIEDTTVEMLDRQWSVNFRAPLFLMQAFRRCVEYGSIINIVDNKIAYNQFQYAAYLTSKKALAELTKMAALEFAPKIRVNAVAPGVVLPANVRSEDYLEWRKAAIPVNQLGSPANVCAAIAGILDNSFINGQILFVDGGEGMNLVGRNALEFGDGAG
jgi:pteridine reductase